LAKPGMKRPQLNLGRSVDGPLDDLRRGDASALARRRAAFSGLVVQFFRLCHVATQSGIYNAVGFYESAWEAPWGSASSLGSSRDEERLAVGLVAGRARSPAQRIDGDRIGKLIV
jgi:hypothetical protein